MSEVAFADAAAEPFFEPPDPFAPTPLPTSSKAQAVGEAVPSFEPPVVESVNQSPVAGEPLLDTDSEVLPVSPPDPLISGLEPVAETPATAKELNPPGSKQGTLIPEEILNAAPESVSWHEVLNGGADTQPAAALGQLAEIVTDQLQRTRISDLILDLQEKMASHGPRHPQVISARQYIEYVIRQRMQLRRQQQEREITRLRNRLIEIEQRLSDRASREDELVTFMIESLVTGIGSRNPAPGSLSGPAWANEHSGLTPARRSAALKPKSALEQSSDRSAGSSSPVEATDFIEFDAASKQLQQLTVRVTCRYERNKGFPPDEYKFDGILLVDRGLIVSALPEELLTTEARESFELSIVFPVTRTTTDASLAIFDEETGLVVLEPDFFPDDTTGLELNLDEIATGDRIFVATVVDGQFNKEQVEVAIASGHARRLVGRPRTISRLATDIQSRPGLGGTPLLSADSRLGGVMSAREPGQYIGAATIEQILAIAKDAHVPDEPPAKTQTESEDQSAGSLESSSESMQHGQKTLDHAFQLHRSVSERKYEVEQAERELNRLQELSNQGDVSPEEVEKAQSALNGARAVLSAVRQTAEIARSKTIAEQYAQAALNVANSEYQVAEEANRKIPNTVPKAELRRLALQVEHWKLELELVRQAQKLLNQTADRLSDDAKAEKPSGSDSSQQPASEPGSDLPAKLDENKDETSN